MGIGFAGNPALRISEVSTSHRRKNQKFRYAKLRALLLDQFFATGVSPQDLRCQMNRRRNARPD
jgi:hypothetical protein